MIQLGSQSNMKVEKGLSEISSSISPMYDIDAIKRHAERKSSEKKLNPILNKQRNRNSRETAYT